MALQAWVALWKVWTNFNELRRISMLRTIDNWRGQKGVIIDDCYIYYKFMLYFTGYFEATIF